MGAWLSTSILMGGWVSTSITMGGWYPSWYSAPSSQEEIQKNRKTLVHTLDCPLCLGNRKFGVIRCKYGQNKCKTCRPNVGLCPYWREAVRQRVKCKSIEYGVDKKLEVHKPSTVAHKVAQGERLDHEKSRHFSIYKCGLAV